MFLEGRDSLEGMDMMVPRDSLVRLVHLVPLVPLVLLEREE